MQVEGPVRFGDRIGPKGYGSWVGVVTTLEVGPVIGIALAGKDSDKVGTVNTLCFAGFNALTPHGSCFKETFQQVPPTQESLPSEPPTAAALDISKSIRRGSSKEAFRQAHKQTDN